MQVSVCYSKVCTKVGVFCLDFTGEHNIGQVSIATQNIFLHNKDSVRLSFIDANTNTRAKATNYFVKQSSICYSQRNNVYE